MVDLRGYVEIDWYPAGEADLEWPAGTVAGDLAIVWASDRSYSQPQTSGWTLTTTDTWVKALTAADLADDLPVRGHLIALTVLYDAARVGNVSTQAGATLTVAGAALYCNGWTSRSTLAAATYRLGAALTEPDGTLNGVFLRTGASPGYVTLDGVGSRTYWRALEILPPDGPSAPTLVSPLVGAQVDRAAAVTLAFVHNSAQGGAMTQCKVLIRAVSTGTWYYVLGDGTLTTTETELTQSAQQVTINGGILSADTTYEWLAYTAEDGDWSTASATWTFVARTAPTVDTITATATPGTLTVPVAWTMTAGVGTQTAFRVRVCAAADATPASPVWDSGVLVGDDGGLTVPALETWENGGSYKAWVEVWQTYGLASAPTVDDTAFEVSWTPPAAPSSVTAANTAGQPLAVTVAGIPGGAGVQVQRYDDATAAWVAVAEATAPDATHVVPVPLAPYGVAVTYRARTFTTVDGVRLYSTWTTSSAVASSDTQAHLVADDGLTYLPVRVAGWSAGLRQGVSVFHALGSDLPSVDLAPAAGRYGRLTLATRTEAEHSTLTAWLSEQAAWWFRPSPKRDAFGGQTRVDSAPVRMARAGDDLGWDPVGDGPLSNLSVSFSWVEQ